MNILSLFNLSENHNTVYMSLLEYGRLQPASIAKITGIKRPTVYLILKELEARGFVKQDLREKGLTYLPTPPIDLGKILQDEERKLHLRKKDFQNFLPTLERSARGKNYFDPKLRIISGDEIEKYLYDNMRLWLEKLNETEEKKWWGFQDATFVDNFEKWIDWSWSITPEEISLNLFTNKEGTEKEMPGRHKQRNMKYLKEHNFTATEWVIGDRIIYFMTKQKPFYAIEIVDPVIASNTRNIFRLLWNNLV